MKQPKLSGTSQPTPSMLYWLQWLADGGVIERTAVTEPTAVQSPKRIGWSTLDKLETGGWITWRDAPHEGGPRKLVVVLTAAGQAAVDGQQ